MIEIDLRKLERGTREGMVTVKRDGKTFQRKQRLGTKEKSEVGKPFANWKSGDPYPKGLKVGAVADMGQFGKYKITNIAGGAIKCDNNRYYNISDLHGIEGVSTDEPKKEHKQPDKKPDKKSVKKPQTPKIAGLTKPKDEQPKKIADYKDAPGIKGSIVKYSSMPATFSLNSDVAKQMGTFRKTSRQSRKEVGAGINVIRGKMGLGKMEMGQSNSMIIMGTSKFGSYHTHPDPAVDTFSMDDVLGLISVHPMNLIMAHSVRSNKLWTAVASAETREMISKLSVKELTAMRSKHLAMSSMISDGISDKNYRNFIKQFCDKYKIGLYVGKTNEDMKKYDGSW